MPLTHFPHGIGTPIVVPGGGGIISTGIGIGDIKWVVPARTSTDKWYERIRQIANDGDIYTTLQAAHDACTTGQGDTIFVAPGLYTTTAQTTFSKSNIQVVGLCGPNNQMTAAGTIASRDNHACTIYCDTAAVPWTMQVTGYRNQFYNMSFVNSGAAATNLGAVAVGRVTTSTAYGNYFNRCTFHGCMDTAQNTINNCSLDIGSGASSYMFEECIIGQNTWGGDRAVAYQGHLHYGGTGDSGAGAGVGAQNGMFRSCLFLSRSAGTITVPMVRIGSGTGAPTSDEAMDRIHWFIDCHFNNYMAAAAANQTTVFDDNSLSWHQVMIVNCSAHQYAEWRIVRAGQNPLGSLQYSVNMAVTNVANAGIGVEPTS